MYATTLSVCERLTLKAEYDMDEQVYECVRHFDPLVSITLRSEGSLHYFDPPPGSPEAHPGLLSITLLRRAQRNG